MACIHTYAFICVRVYLCQARHLSFLQWCSDGGSKRLTIVDRPAFQEVFSCLVDVDLDHLPFELWPLWHQHLPTGKEELQMAVHNKFKKPC